MFTWRKLGRREDRRQENQIEITLKNSKHNEWLTHRGSV